MLKRADTRAQSCSIDKSLEQKACRCQRSLTFMGRLFLLLLSGAAMLRFQAREGGCLLR